MHFAKLSALLPLLAGAAEGSKFLAPRSRGAGRFDMYADWNPFGFLGKATVGTPALHIPVFIDWTWISTYIVGPKCSGKDDPSLCLNADQLFFDRSKSSTYKDRSGLYNTRTWLPNHFFFWNPLTVEYGQDKVSIGPVEADVVLQTSDLGFDISAFPYPFTAVLGLSPVFKGDNASFQPAFYQQWARGLWKKPTLSWIYCYEEKSKAEVCNGHDGIQSFGGILDERIKGPIYWYENKVFPDVNELMFEYGPGLYNYWATTLDQLKIGDEVQPTEPTSDHSGKGAIFDHASYGRGTPLTENSYIRLVELTGGRPIELEQPLNNGNQSYFQVDCNATATYPPISYRFEGHKKEWIVKPKHYVDNIGNNTCVLNVRTLATGNRFIGTFGETFSKGKVIIQDFEKLRNGLAEVNFGESNC